MPFSILNILRIALYGFLIFLVITIVQVWQKEHPSASTVQTIEKHHPIELLPSSLKETTINESHNIQKKDVKGKSIPLVYVTTDVIKTTINPIGGNIINVDLLKYAKNLNSKERVQLLNNNPETRYIAQSGLLGKEGPDTFNSQAQWTPEKLNYSMGPKDNELKVKMHYQNKQGIKFTKIFTFKRNEYQVNLNYIINNPSSKAWDGNLFLKLSRTNSPPETHHGIASFATFFGTAISSPEKAYKKIKFADFQKNPLDETIKNGWLAMEQHYFIGAWVPAKNYAYRYFTQAREDNLFTVGALGPKIYAGPNETITTNAKFYAGPAIAKRLEKVAPHLQLTIDYGWLWMISAAIFWLMQKIHIVVGNWGWSIVIVTFFIKLCFYPLSSKSFRSMSGLRRLQPKINALRETYKDDKQKLTQATLELYRKEKVNPMSGCLPILVQIPVFISLYWVLVESIQLRQAPFIFWIHDLSIKDPYYVLPVLMGISMFIQQRLSPSTLQDPTQAKLMMLMPVFFTVMFASFPSGLMLYWFVNTSLSCLQQWYVMRSTELHYGTKKDKKSALLTKK